MIDALIQSPVHIDWTYLLGAVVHRLRKLGARALGQVVLMQPQRTAASQVELEAVPLILILALRHHLRLDNTRATTHAHRSLSLRIQRR